MGEDDTKKGYDVPLIRLKDDKSKLDVDDLDEEERAALAEVSKKGYYHSRPKTVEAPPPQRIENPEALAAAEKQPRKRSTFDKYQEKWDQFDKKEPIVREAKSPPTSGRPKAAEVSKGGFFGCCKRRA
mmetsp:Transcript_84571/g.244463  ORF Transcript_84571/g.244463 Transcript_84571/m.244463 type:complete len:128 (-) Transcript_84571:125-508(-)